jgi:hypothetical protein
MKLGIKYQLEERKPIADNKMNINDAVCRDPEASSCKQGNELSCCMCLGDILTT